MFRKIKKFESTSDGRYLIELLGLSRFKIIKEIKNDKSYRECEINFNDFKEDTQLKKEELKFSDLRINF